MGDLDLDAPLLGHLAELGAQRPLVAVHDLGPAVGDDHLGHARFLAPGELGADGRVADEGVVALANHRARDRRPIPHVNLGAREGLLPVADPDHVGHVKDGDPPGGDTIAHRRRSRGMLHRERLEGHVRDLDRLAGGDDPPLLDLKILHPLPRALGGIDRAGGARLQAKGVIGVGVRDQDSLDVPLPHLARPVLAAVDHGPPAIVRDL